MELQFKSKYLLYYICIIGAYFAPWKAKSETAVDLKKIQYCRIISESAATFAAVFYKEGSNGVTWERKTQIDDSFSHFENLAIVYSLPYIEPDRIMEMYDHLERKYGYVGAFDFLQIRIEECLVEFPM